MLRLRLPWLAFGFGLMVAQAAPAQPQGGRSAAAEALFSDGIELATAGKYAAALDKLRASYELEAARGTLQAIGLAEERSGKLASAYATYVKLRDLSQQAGDASRLEYARERLRAIAAKLARIVIQPGRMPADAKLFMDDVPLPLASAETAMPVNAGRHELKVESEGREVWSEIFTVRDGEKRTLRIDVVLPSKRQTSPPALPQPVEEDSSPTMRLVGLVTVGAGALVLGTGTFLFLDGRSEEEEVARQCPGDTCPTSDLQQRGNDASGRKVAGLVTGGVGLVLMGAGALLYFSHGEKSVAVHAGPTWVGLRGRF